MKTISTKILSGAVLLGGVLFASCQRTGVNASGLVNPIDTRDGSFTIVGNLSDYQTRAHDAVWDAGDQIGVFAFTAGTSNLFNNFANVQYNTVDVAGIFKAANGGVVLKGTEKADITAYYPFASGLNGNTYVVNVSDQSDLKKLDLLWGKGTLTADATTQTVPVKFAHKLSLIQIRFTSKAGETLPASIKASLKGVKTVATFDVASGAFTLGETTGDITLPAKDGALNLILLPGDVLSGLEFDFDGKVVPFKFPEVYTLKENTKYTFTFTPTKDLKSVTLQVDGSSISDWGSEVTFEGDVPYGDVVDPGTPDPGTPEEPGVPAPEPGTPSELSLAFQGGDFESDLKLNNFGLLKDKTNGLTVAIEDKEGVNGSKGLVIKGTWPKDSYPKNKNPYLFTSIDSKATASTKSMSFMLKGTAEGAISINVYDNTAKYVPFNLGTVNGEKTLSKAASNQYSGSIDTKGEWVKITLNLEGIELNTTGTGSTFAFKIAGDKNYDIVIDNIELK